MIFRFFYFKIEGSHIINNKGRTTRKKTFGFTTDALSIELPMPMYVFRLVVLILHVCNRTPTVTSARGIYHKYKNLILHKNLKNSIFSTHMWVKCHIRAENIVSILLTIII